MEKITSFIKNNSASSKFLVTIDGETPFMATCSIHFVFLTISCPEKEFESTIFLPEYGPAVNFGMKGSGKVLMYTPLNSEHREFTIESEELIKIDQFAQLSINAIITLNEFLKLFKGYLNYAEHLIAIFPPNDLDRPIYLILHDTKLLFNDNDEMICEIDITQRTELVFPGIGEQPSFKISDNSNQLIDILPFSVDSLLTWFSAIYVTRYLVEENQKKLIEGIGTIKMFVNEKEVSVSEDEKSSDDKEDMKEESKNNSAESSKPKANVKTENEEEPKKESLSINRVPDISQYIKNKEERKKELSESNEATKKMLKLKLEKSKGKIRTQIATEEIPTLSFPKQQTYDKVELSSIKVHETKSIGKDEIFNLIENRLSKGTINLKHYFKHPKPTPRAPDLMLEYNPKDPKSFYEKYSTATNEEAYNMLLGLVLSQFTGTSIASVFSMKGEFQSLGEEAMYVVDSLGNGVVPFILSSPEIRSNYRISALANDVQLLESLPNRDVRISYDSKPIYMFPHRPILDLRTSMHKALLSVRARKLNPIKVFQDFSRSWIAIFQNNIATSIDEFFFAIANKLKGNEEWSIFTLEGEFRQKWALFLLHSMREEKVVENLLEVFNFPEIIDKHYNLCADVRNHHIVSEVIILTQIFAEFHIKLSNDGEVEQPLPGAQFFSIFQ